MHDADGFVYVNQDGTARELSKDEQQYLAAEFHPTDGARPYVKASYTSRDGWGSVSGFLLRSQLPRGVVVEPVHPQYTSHEPDARQQVLEEAKRLGDIVVQHSDGSVTCTPHPDVSRQQRFELLRELTLERQRERERLAKHPGSSARQ